MPIIYCQDGTAYVTNDWGTNSGTCTVTSNGTSSYWINDTTTSSTSSTWINNTPLYWWQDPQINTFDDPQVVRSPRRRRRSLDAQRGDLVAMMEEGVPLNERQTDRRYAQQEAIAVQELHRMNQQLLQREEARTPSHHLAARE